VILVLSNIRMLPFALFRKERYTLQSLFHMTTLKLKVYYEFYLKKKKMILIFFVIFLLVFISLLRNLNTKTVFISLLRNLNTKTPTYKSMTSKTMNFPYVFLERKIQKYFENTQIMLTNCDTFGL